MASGYSCNDNQNYFVSEGRTTSRVLQMPGGKSSFTLFGSAPEVSRTPSKKSQDSEIPSTPMEKKHNVATSTDNPLNTSISSNKYASGSNMNSGNVITDRPSSRVLNPPGGKTSLSLF